MLKALESTRKRWFDNGFRIQPIGINEKSISFNMKNIRINNKQWFYIGFRIKPIGINEKHNWF